MNKQLSPAVLTGFVIAVLLRFAQNAGPASAPAAPTPAENGH